MRKLKLFLASLVLVSWGGVNSASAYTTSDLTSAGWTQVIASSITGNADNYYVLVDANSSNYVMSNDAAHYRPCYKTIADPLANPSFVWILEGTDNTYALKSYSTGSYFIQASGWDTSMTGATGSATFQFTLNDGKYSIKCVQSDKLVGHWNDDGAAVANDGESIAANKDASNAPGFYLYSISKSAYDTALLATRKSAVASATKASPSDVTSYIQNADWSGDWGGWARSGTWGNQQWGQKTLESWNATNVTVKQELQGVPNGLYKVTADVISGNNNNKVAYVYAIGDTKVSSSAVSAEASAGDYTTMSSEVAGKTLTADNISVQNNAITVGIDQAAGWIVADNFKLYYYGPTVGGEAVEFTSGSAIAADTWYYFDVAATGDYRFTTTDALNNIVYTQVGTTLIEEVAETHPTEVTNLTIGRIYFKATAAATLTIEPNSYSYNVGAPTPSISNGEFVSAFSTITFNFADAASNDPDATFAVLNNTAKAALKKDGSTIAEGTLSLSGKALTATFDALALTQGAAYTVEIAADVVGFAGQVANTAISTTFNTGVIANGVYYFKKNDADLYITRGGYYGTEGVVDNFGLSFEASLQTDGTYTLKNVDHSLAANADKFLNGGGSTYTDQGAFNWTIEATDGGYYLRPSSTEYMAATAQGEYPYSYLSKTTDASAAYIWSLLSKSEYAAALAAAKNTQAAAVATAAGISATTVAELESTLAADFGATDMTSNITNAALTANMNGWTQVKYNGVTYKDADANGTAAEIWNSTGGVKQDVAGLPAGIYKVTVVATWRPGNLATATRVGAEANTTAWMYANTGSEANITQLKSWYEGGATINSRGDLVTNKANYMNTTYVYVAEGQTLTIGLASPSFCVEPWFPFFDWTLTRYEAKATEAEKQALADAIAAAKAKTLGFKDGEYAPYNNVAALQALAAAKALDADDAFGADVVAATTALTGASWTANTGEVNAIYGGDFTKYETISGEDMPYGWNLYNGADNHSRIMGGTQGTGNAGLEASTSGKALLLKFNGTYGETEGYTMPLRGGKIYKITFKYCGWGKDDLVTTNVVMTDPDNTEIALAPGFIPKAKNGESDKTLWSDYTGYFVASTSGDYKLNLNKVVSGQHQIAIADIELLSASEIEFADNASVPTYAPGTYPSVKITRTLTAGRWATAVYPFAVRGVSEIAVLDSYDASQDALGFKTATASEANVPFLMRSTAGAAEIALSNVAVVAAAAADAVKIEASLKGTYTATDIDAGTGVYNYVLSNNTIYKVGEKGATINPYRAYIQLTQPTTAARLSFFIDGEETQAIEGISVAESQDGEVVYNLQGQRVVNARKGLFIKNGKKVVRK